MASLYQTTHHPSQEHTYNYHRIISLKVTTSRNLITSQKREKIKETILILQTISFYDLIRTSPLDTKIKTNYECSSWIL